MLLFSVFFTSSPSIASQKNNFEIKHADTLQTDQENIVVKGDVVVNYKDAVIEAPEAIIETIEKGKPYKAIFTNGSIRLKDRNLKANKITILIEKRLILAKENVMSELKDKKNNSLIINSDYQELYWSGEDASANGNLKTIYNDTQVTADELKVIYKNKRPTHAIFFGTKKPVHLEQPTNITFAKEITFEINSENFEAKDQVETTIWPDKNLPRTKQDPIIVKSDELYIDNETGTVKARAQENTNKVQLNYQEISGESQEALLVKENKNGKPEKIIFKGNANVSQLDKELRAEEIVFDLNDKKLTSDATANKRPKTTFFKKDEPSK